MTRKSKILTTSLLVCAFVGSAGLSPAMAQNTYTPGIDQAQHEVSQRIQQGLASGRITPSEAQQLYRREREIEIHESRSKANGSATPQERQQLRAELAGLNAEIDRLMSRRPVVVAPAQPVYPAQPGYSGSASQTPGIDNRQFNISRRIDEGVRAGRINPREARRLHEREREIARREAFFKSNGVVTPQERRQLRDELDALSRDVERAMRWERR
ncbi:MAG: hypothetical protein ACWA6Y_05965 [Polaromonas sp.]